MGKSDPAENGEGALAQPDAASTSSAFLLAEMQTIREMRASLNSLVSSEISIFLAMVTATFVGLAFASEKFAVSDAFVVVAIWALTVVALLGWALFTRVVRSRVEVVKYARTLNRIRNYFLDSDGSIQKYMSTEIYDDQPPFGSIGSSRPRFLVLSGNTGMIAILNSGVVSSAIASLSYLFGTDNLTIMSALVTLTFILGMAVHE